MIFLVGSSGQKNLDMMLCCHLTWKLNISDLDVDLKACIACLSYIITSTVRFDCDHSALYSELQQLGLPPEHSTSIKRVVDDVRTDLSQKLKNLSLKGRLYSSFSVVQHYANLTPLGFVIFNINVL